MKALMAEVIIESLRRMNTVDTWANSGGSVWQRIPWLHAATFGDGLGQQGHAHAGGNTREDAVEGAQFHDLVGHQPDLIEPVFRVER
jgi:hypothetical protein